MDNFLYTQISSERHLKRVLRALTGLIWIILGRDGWNWKGIVIEMSSQRPKENP